MFDMAERLTRLALITIAVKMAIEEIYVEVPEDVKINDFYIQEISKGSLHHRHDTMPIFPITAQDASGDDTGFVYAHQFASWHDLGEFRQPTLSHEDEENTVNDAIFSKAKTIVRTFLPYVED